LTKLNQSVKPVLSGFYSDVRTVIQLSYVMAEFCSVLFAQSPWAMHSIGAYLHVEIWPFAKTRPPHTARLHATAKSRDSVIWWRLV